MKNLILLLSFFTTVVFGALTVPPTNLEKEYLPQNSFVNPGFESGISGWCKTGSTGSAPTNEILCGGTTNLTIATTTSSPLSGSRSLLITKPASNEQGDGVVVDLNISAEQASKTNILEFTYSTTGTFTNGTLDGTTASDVRVYLADKTTSTIIQVFPNTLDGSGKFSGQFLASANTQYQLLLWVSTTNASAWTLKVDSFKARLAEWTVVNSDSDWVSYTPTFTGFGTASAVNFRYRKDGPNLLVSGTFTSGTSTSTEARVSLPSGLLSVSGLPTLQKVGDYATTLTTSNSARGGAVLVESSVNYVTFGTELEAGTTAALVKRNGDVMTASGTTISFEISVPIQGWTSGSAVIGNIFQNTPVYFKANKVGGSVSASTTIPTWTNTVIDTAGGFNASTGQYTVRVPGTYRVNLNLNTTTGSVDTTVRKNGTAIGYGTYVGATSQGDSLSTLLPNLVVGDIITVEIGTAKTLVSDANANYFELERLLNPNALLSINRSTTKYLASNVTSTTAGIASLAFSNLIVGKKYRIDIFAAHDSVAGSSASVLQAVHNGSTVAQSYSNINATAYFSTYAEFTATATSLAFNWTETGTATLFGNGTQSATKATLTELNNTVEGGF